MQCINYFEDVCMVEEGWHFHDFFTGKSCDFCLISSIGSIIRFKSRHMYIAFKKENQNWYPEQKRENASLLTHFLPFHFNPKRNTTCFLHPYFCKFTCHY